MEMCGRMCSISVVAGPSDCLPARPRYSAHSARSVDSADFVDSAGSISAHFVVAAVGSFAAAAGSWPSAAAEPVAALVPAAVVLKTQEAGTQTAYFAGVALGILVVQQSLVLALKHRGSSAWAVAAAVACLGIA